MPRIRTIQPHFARSPSMGRVSRDARLLFVLLWTVVDDEGRCHADLDNLAKVLYPSDFDASLYLLAWLDELEREGCIERYAIDQVEYLRVVHWHEHQWIGHPTPGCLPPSPHERPHDSGILEASGRLRGKRRKMPSDQELGEQSRAFPENDDISAEDEEPVVVDQQILLRDLRRIQRNAEADRSHANALRSVAMRAQFGLPTGKSGRPRSQSPGERLPREDISPSLGELHDMPNRRRSGD